MLPQFPVTTVFDTPRSMCLLANMLWRNVWMAPSNADPINHVWMVHAVASSANVGIRRLSVAQTIVFPTATRRPCAVSIPPMGKLLVASSYAALSMDGAAQKTSTAKTQSPRLVKRKCLDLIVNRCTSSNQTPDHVSKATALAKSSLHRRVERAREHLEDVA